MCWQSAGNVLGSVGMCWITTGGKPFLTRSHMMLAESWESVGECWHVLAECWESVGDCWEVLACVGTVLRNTLFDQITRVGM